MMALTLARVMDEGLLLLHLVLMSLCGASRFLRLKTALNTMLTESKARIGIVLICMCLIVVPAMAAGAYTTIPQGGTVFIGEQGLDVTTAMGGDTAIGWWASVGSDCHEFA